MNTKTKALLAFVTIFVVGFASGYLSSDVIATTDTEYTEQYSERRERILRLRNMKDAERAKHLRLKIQDRLAERLDLTANQQGPFFEQMSEYRSTLRQSVHDMRSREAKQIREYYNTFKAEISTILNETQLRKLDSQLHPDSVRMRRWREAGPGRN